MAWTEKEIKEYKELYNTDKDIILRSVYLQAKIPADKPEERTKYLAEHILNLTMTNHDVIMGLAKERGKFMH
jgi:hypothetical protein